MRLYNTLTRTEEEFTPADGRTVRMYTCGLTVYARGHIGNFRSFVCVDVLRRALRHQEGFDMRHVMNFTDVDDKTIAEAEKAGVPLREYTTRFVEGFWEDADALGLERPEETPRATDEPNLRAMADMILALGRNGHTYETEGATYFRIATLPDYGKLARLDVQGMEAGARVDSDQYDKDDPRDFVLWKATKPGEPMWDYGCGPGRPGWHIECSAMALRLLGEPPIDLHTGGVDLIFPHHENEIAQAEGATKKPFVRFWFHVEFLNLDNEKMSKSVGNIFTVRDVLERGHRASALRYVLLSSHYRKQLKFNWDTIAQAEEALKRLSDFLGRLDAVPGAGSLEPGAGLAAALASAREAFRSHIAADLNTAGALGAMFDLVRVLNAKIDAGEVDAAAAQQIRALFDEFDLVLGVMALRRREDAAPPIPLDEIEQAIEARREARTARDFAAADGIRAELEKKGILLEDTAAGTQWKRR
ncbi:MAG TPA: cysteine--tRNA ligase [Vicinamibacterales bacterium]|nr:cysteine--tRNA ligase [Vicinamibacterales bacterium]